MKNDKKKYKLTLSYDGTDYSGWQVQKEGIRSIQSLIQQALATILREKISLIGAGRTDAGVHALGQVAHFSTHLAIEERNFRHRLNSILPKDIRIHQMVEIDPLFHARYSATRKIYHYHFHLGAVHNPFSRRYSLHVPYHLDIPLLKQASQLFLGSHDFSSFANDAKKGTAAKNAIRTLYRCDVMEEKEQLRLEFEGDGFLYKMVRNMVGSLLEIATHKMSLDRLATLFALKDRRYAPPTAPAHGLFLIQVNYPKEFSEISSKDP